MRERAESDEEGKRVGMSREKKNRRQQRHKDKTEVRESEEAEIVRQESQRSGGTTA